MPFSTRCSGLSSEESATWRSNDFRLLLLAFAATAVQGTLKLPLLQPPGLGNSRRVERQVRRILQQMNVPMRVAASLPMAAILILVQSSPSSGLPPDRPAAERVSLSYTLTAFAIPFGHLDYAANSERTRYHAEMSFRTSGLAAVLWKSKIDTSTEGRVTPEELLVPNVYTSHSLSRSGVQQSVRVDYGKHPPVMTADPSYNLSSYPISDEQKKGAVDPVTAITSIIEGLNASDGEPCGRTLAVFDGRRRYDVVFTLVREEPIAPGGAIAKARVCKAEYRQIAGIKQEVVDVSSVPPIYAEFVDLTGAIRRHHTIARAIWLSFLWGAVNAKLTDLRIQGQPVALAP
jgi:hypothetical protein